MASRTKSFFEQNHNGKSRPNNWSRSNHNSHVHRPDQPQAAVTKPPIPATSQSKSKLKAFQFTEDGRNGSDADDKENAPTASITEPIAESAHSAPESVGHSKKTPQLPHANTFPSTPAARLPLADLIGNFDDASRRPAPVEESPEEHIGWIPNSSNTLLTPGRKRKRARSSSPLSSSQRATEASRFEFAPGSAEKKTPEADPAADLWQRYATGKEAEDGLKLPDFSHLMFQASPRLMETPVRKGDGLRRWASTGADWPSSKVKRRRTTAKPSVAVWQEEECETGGKSKVAAMVEKIQESLASQKLGKPKAKPEMRAEGPSSSSPLPEIGALEGLMAVPTASPLQARQEKQAQHVEQTHKKDTMARKENMPALSQDKQDAGSEDFGSDLTVEDIQKSRPANDSIISAPLHLKSKAPLPAFKRPSISRMPTPVQLASTLPVIPQTNEDVDEFGDDMDLTAEDMEELMSQAPPIKENTPLHQIPEHPNPPPQQVAPLQLVADDAAMLELAAAADLDDEFGDDDIDEDSFAQAEMSATQAFRASGCSNYRSPRKPSPRKLRSPTKSSRQSSPKRRDRPPWEAGYQRYVVNDVIDGEYTNDRGRTCLEKVLLADDENTKKPTAITLRDSWVHTEISSASVVHVIRQRSAHSRSSPPFEPPGQIMIHDGEDGRILILHPDHMLSATTVADSFDCIRKAVLQDRIKATSEANKAMVYGSILHEVFQTALTSNNFSASNLAGIVGKVVQGHVEGLWELGMQDTVLAVEELTGKMSELSAWARIFVAAEPSELSQVDDKRGEKVWMAISKLIAIEEHIWSPQYGLKGNVDATVQIAVQDNPREPSKKLVVPLEVKTGRTTKSASHQAQTALYTLLLSDRYDLDIEAGVLYYLESSAMSRIAPPKNEVRQMIQQRNRLAAFINRARNCPKPSGEDINKAVTSASIQDSGLPDMLRNPYKCGKCYAQQSCFTYHALGENGTSDTAGLVDDGKKNHSLVWQEAVGHLGSEDPGDAQLKHWFAKWDRLLTFEESEMSRWRKELWNMAAAQREAVGRCFGGLVIADNGFLPSSSQSTGDDIEGGGGKINRFSYTFTRLVANKDASFAEGSQLTIGEPIVVSSERGQWALANGYVSAVSRHNITVAVDRRLGDARQRLSGFNADANQAFRGIMTVGKMEPDAATVVDGTTIYRLDKDEFSNGLALVRNSLVQLMASSPLASKLRRLIASGEKPVFSSVPPMQPLPPSQLGNMNEDQRAAVSTVLSAQDYALILGMPGTGKTTTIAHVIRALLSEGKTILLASFTHTAVDNILLKIRDIAPPNSILRLGVLAKINTQVQEFCQLAATPRKTIEQIDTAYMGSKIVATTCLGTNHPLFKRRVFDVCIVDEASQITLPTSLGPLLHARKFVLVGDHFQLPPLVQNKAALEGGLDVSLFRTLSEAHPEAIATLGCQYRMCEDIMSLSDSLIYDGKLRCGSEIVARRELEVPYPRGLDKYHSVQGDPGDCAGGHDCWLFELSSARRKVVFANTDAMRPRSLETLNSGKNMTNQVEATLTAQLVLSLLAQDVPAKDIGVITLYRSQLALLRQLFRATGISEEVEIDSADRFQGRDKECVILSMVRSNEAGIVGDLLKDWRRVNVALTRARSKLVVLGSRKTLGCNDLLARFLELVDGKGWAVDLPAGADGDHASDLGTRSAADLVTQKSPAKKASSSPCKNRAAPSPSKRPSPKKVLGDSKSAGNRYPVETSSLKRGGLKTPGRTIVSSKRLQSLSSLFGGDSVLDDIFRDVLGQDVVLSQ